MNYEMFRFFLLNNFHTVLVVEQCTSIDKRVNSFSDTKKKTCIFEF